MKSVDKRVVRESTSEGAIAAQDQVEMAAELTALEEKLGLVSVGVDKVHIGTRVDELAERRQQLVGQLQDAEAVAAGPSMVDSEVNRRVQQPGEFAQFIKRIPVVGRPLAKTLNTLGILDTEPKLVREHVTNIKSPEDLAAEAEAALNEARAKAA